MMPSLYGTGQQHTSAQHRNMLWMQSLEHTIAVNNRQYNKTSGATLSALKLTSMCFCCVFRAAAVAESECNAATAKFQ
jgi:hypothetical protein